MAKYRNKLAPKHAENKIKLLMHELAEIRNSLHFKQSQNSRLLGNAAKAERNLLNYS